MRPLQQTNGVRTSASDESWKVALLRQKSCSQSLPLSPSALTGHFDLIA
jgi:hypothetical protein